ncbi:dTMP kinase [Patescibacteria group bacterium]
MRKKGKLVIVDGIDGSGKGTLIYALEKWAEKKGMKVFNIVNYEKKHHDLPEMKQLKDYQVIVSAEPTHSLVGRAIREEIIRRNPRSYSPKALAHAYALDRYILYNRIHIPALKAGKFIFQERGVTSSIVYQPTYSKKLPLKYIMGIHGNKIAIEHRPDLLCVLRVNPSEAIKRLSKRSKQDKAVFENVKFLTKAQKRFEAKWFHELFIKLGTRVEMINTKGTIIESTERIVQIWEDFIKTRTS